MFRIKEKGNYYLIYLGRELYCTYLKYTNDLESLEKYYGVKLKRSETIS